MAGEKNFENRVKKFLSDHGCYCLKYWGGGQFTKSGVPDLLVCCCGQFLGVELKAEHGHPSPLQLHHIAEIRKAGGWAFVLWPDGFEDFKGLVEALEDGERRAAETHYIRLQCAELGKGVYYDQVG